MRGSIAALLVCGLACLAGCAPFEPAPVGRVPFLRQAQTEEQDGLRVTVSVPTGREARQIFGVPLYKKGIQPVWIDIENASDRTYWCMLSGVDPDYFSAREAAYICHTTGRGSRNRAVDLHFERLAIDQLVLPRCRSAGFCFSHVKQGTKEVRIRLFGDGRVVDFEFHVHVPGLRADWEKVRFDSLYAEEEFVRLEDQVSLREALARLPARTSRKDGTGQGDPLNIVVIGDLEKPFSRARWDQTERLTLGSAWKTVKSFFGGTYKHSPMSSLYVFGRHQDMGLQKARESIHERNHLRLWLTPLIYRGQPVWVGTVSRDIGVYATSRAWNLTTHAIDPDVDEARDYLTEDLARAQSLERFGYVQGDDPATAERPHRTLLDAPYWTDGERGVLLLTDGTVPLEEIEHFNLERKLDRRRCAHPVQEAVPPAREEHDGPGAR